MASQALPEANEGLPKPKDVERVLDILRSHQWRVTNDFGLVFLATSSVVGDRARLESEYRKLVNDALKTMTPQQFLSLLPHFNDNDRWRLRKLRKILKED